MPPLQKPPISAAAITSILLLLLVISGLALPNNSREETAAADSMQRKIDDIEVNSRRTPPRAATTEFSEKEINAYFAERRLKMPDGVRSVVFQLSPGEVTASSHVDFDQLTKGRSSSNPLLLLFSGMHDVQVEANASGEQGTAHISVQSVAIDGVPVPRMALKLFLEKYVQPKYPNVKLDGDYRLPARIQSVVISDDKGIVTQK